MRVHLKLLKTNNREGTRTIMDKLVDVADGSLNGADIFALEQAVNSSHEYRAHFSIESGDAPFIRAAGPPRKSLGDMLREHDSP